MRNNNLRIRLDIREMGAYNLRICLDIRELGEYKLRICFDIREMGANNLRIHLDIREMGAYNLMICLDIREMGAYLPPDGQFYTERSGFRSLLCLQWKQRVLQHEAHQGNNSVNFC